MIIGNGMIARAFEAAGCADNAVIFASGVSNSSESSGNEFERERVMLEDCLKNLHGKTIVYFSSCALVDNNMVSVPYYKHKHDMEEYVKSSYNYIIVRLPQLIGKTHNPHTILNYFKNHIEAGDDVKVQSGAYRYFIDVDDVVVFVCSLLALGKINLLLDFANPVRYSAEAVFLTVAQCLGKDDPEYTVIEGGVAYEIDFKEMNYCLDECGLDFNFGENYFQMKLGHMSNSNETVL